MDCPYCGASSRVVDSRPTHDGIRRRRVCGECKRRFTTYERLGPTDIKVIKRGGGHPEVFDHAKLVRAMKRVCQGRSVSVETIERVARHIEAQLLDQRRPSVPSWEIADMVLKQLEQLDAVAYGRFAIDYLADDGSLRTEPREAVPNLPQLDLFEDDGQAEG